MERERSVHSPSVPGLFLFCFSCASLPHFSTLQCRDRPLPSSYHRGLKAVSTRELYYLSPTSLRDIVQASYFMDGEMNGKRTRGSLNPISKRFKDESSKLLPHTESFSTTTILFSFKNYFILFYREREREGASGGEGKRPRERISGRLRAKCRV